MHSPDDSGLIATRQRAAGPPISADPIHPSRISSMRVTVAMALLFAAIYLFPLGLRPLVAPDEPRYGEIPREMIRSGDWIVPHLNGVRYFEKPVLGYWIVAASMLIFGEN